MSKKNDFKDVVDVPNYYIGDTYREGYYQARYVVEDFNCTWNIGNVVTYCLRSSEKHESPIECLQKSINHLKFEIERLEKFLNQLRFEIYLHLEYPFARLLKIKLKNFQTYS